MKKLLKTSLLIMLIISLIGCASHQRFTKVDSSNGINKYEAVLIAEKEIKSADFKHYFSAIDPDVRNDQHVLKYPNYWFVEYTPDVYMDFMSYLIVINKRSGEVIRSRDYYWPDHNWAVDWIFN